MPPVDRRCSPSSGPIARLARTRAGLRVAVVASASLLQGKLTQHLPATLHEALPGFSTDAQRAIAFVRSLPMVTTALVGTKSVRHLRENLAAARRA